MKRLAIVLGLVLAAMVLVGQPRECRSGWCPTYTCYGSSACMGCVCMSNDFGGGACVDLEALPDLLELGYRRLP